MHLHTILTVIAATATGVIAAAAIGGLVLRGRRPSLPTLTMLAGSALVTLSLHRGSDSSWFGWLLVGGAALAAGGAAWHARGAQARR